MGSKTDKVPKGETSIGVRVTSCYPKGEALSPLLKNLVVDVLLDELKGQGCNLVGYADVPMIIVRVQCLFTIIEVTQMIMNVKGT